MNALRPFKQHLIALSLLLGLAGASTLPLPVQRVWAQPNPAIMAKGEELLKNGDGKGAKSVFLQLLQRYPASVDARVSLAQIAIREYEYDTARMYLESALESRPGRVDILAELGRLFHLWSVNPSPAQENYHARSEEFFRQAQMVNPDNPQYLAYYGEWLLDQNQLLDAHQQFQKALVQSPQFVPAMLGEARYALKTSNFKKAKHYTLQAMELDPDSSDAYLMMARMLNQANHPEEAIKFAKKSETFDYGTLPQRDALLAKAYEKLGDFKNAQIYYERLNQLVPNQPDLLAKVGEMATHSGDANTANSTLQSAYQMDGTLIHSLLDKAHQALREERTDIALPLLRQALSLSPGQEEALHGLASAHAINAFYGKSTPNEVKSDLVLFEEQVQKQYPGGPSPLIRMDRLKLLQAAGESIQQELQLLSNSQDPLAAGEALFLLGEYPKAQEQLDAVDGQNARGYQLAADRLLSDQELILSQALYQRGNQMENLSGIVQGLQRIERKYKLAQQKVVEGNLYFDKKQYKTALPFYQQAQKIYRQWEVPYLRLADTYDHLHDKASAATAYQQAVKLNPTLMDSKGFSKKFKKINPR